MPPTGAVTAAVHPSCSFLRIDEEEKHVLPFIEIKKKKKNSLYTRSEAHDHHAFRRTYRRSGHFLDDQVTDFSKTTPSAYTVVVIEKNTEYRQWPSTVDEHVSHVSVD